MVMATTGTVIDENGNVICLNKRKYEKSEKAILKMQT